MQTLTAHPSNFINAGMLIKRKFTKHIMICYITESHLIKIFKNNHLIDIQYRGEEFTAKDFDLWYLEQLNNK
jgi:hypothetical protein